MAILPPRTAVETAMAAALLIAVLFSSATPRAEAAGACDTDSAALDDAEMEMLRLHNDTRTQQGLSALVVSPGLNRMAAWKSGDSSASGAQFSHTDSLGRGPGVRSRDCGFPADAAENIAFGYPSTRAAFDAFMNSPGHRTNVLMSYYQTIGIGRVGDRWTVNFGIYDDNGAAAAPAIPVPVQPQAPATPPAPRQPDPPAAAAAEPTPSPPPPGLQLSAGVTLVTYDGPTVPINEAVQSLGSGLRFVYSFDASTGHWQRYAPGAPPYVNSLASLETGGRYFVGLHEATSWEW